MSDINSGTGLQRDLTIPARLVFAVVALMYAGVVSSGAVFAILLIKGFGVQDFLAYAITGAVLFIAYYPVLLVWIERRGARPRYGFAVHCIVTVFAAAAAYFVSYSIFG